MAASAGSAEFDALAAFATDGKRQNFGRVAADDGGAAIHQIARDLGAVGEGADGHRVHDPWNAASLRGGGGEAHGGCAIRIHRAEIDHQCCSGADEGFNLVGAFDHGRGGADGKQRIRGGVRDDEVGDVVDQGCLGTDRGDRAEDILSSHLELFSLHHWATCAWVANQQPPRDFI